MRRILTCILAFILCMLLCACQNKQQDTNDLPPSPVMESQTVVVGGGSSVEESTPPHTATPEPTPEPTATPVPLSCAGVWKVEVGTLSMTLTIEPEGSFTLIEGEQTRQGQIIEEGDSLRFVWETGEYACSFQMQEDRLLLLQEGYADLIFEREGAEA